MQEVIIRQADINDIDTVTELENSCFPVSEAADRKAFEQRLRNYPECFRLLEIDGKVISMINGMTTNENDLCDEMYSGTDMYAAHGKWLMLFGFVSEGISDSEHGGAEWYQMRLTLQ